MSIAASQTPLRPTILALCFLPYVWYACVRPPHIAIAKSFDNSGVEFVLFLEHTLGYIVGRISLGVDWDNGLGDDRACWLVGWADSAIDRLINRSLD